MPEPIRRRWRRRALWALAILALPFAGIAWRWHWLQAEIEAELAAARARGEPTTVAELAEVARNWPQPNGAAALMRAICLNGGYMARDAVAESIELQLAELAVGERPQFWPKGRWDFPNLPGDFLEQHWLPRPLSAIEQQCLADRAALWPLVERAVAMPTGPLARLAELPNRDFNNTSIPDVRSLGNDTLLLAEIAALNDGDSKRAATLCLQWLRLSRALDAEPELWAHYVRLVIVRDAMTGLALYLGRMPLDDATSERFDRELARTREFSWNAGIAGQRVLDLHRCTDPARRGAIAKDWLEARVGVANGRRIQPTAARRWQHWLLEKAYNSPLGGKFTLGTQRGILKVSAAAPQLMALRRQDAETALDDFRREHANLAEAARLCSGFCIPPAVPSGAWHWTGGLRAYSRATRRCLASAALGRVALRLAAFCRRQGHWPATLKEANADEFAREALAEFGAPALEYRVAPPGFRLAAHFEWTGKPSPDIDFEVRATPGTPRER